MLLSGLKGRSLPSGFSGFSDFEDVGVVPIEGENDLLFTADFFTPIVDDPHDFGGIAAANALSDIYAKGGQPLAALNLAAFPESIDRGVLREILRGGGEKAAEGGAPVVGGHTVKDREIKYGMAVIGKARRGEFLPIRTARPGDSIVLGKAIGTGILSTALKRGFLDDTRLASLTSSMLLLNRDASELARRHRATACTDVTGYGLLGHLHNLTRASGVTAEISFGRVPLLDGAQELAAAGCVPGGGKANLAYADSFTTIVEELDPVGRILLADPQTSGGLLLTVDPPAADGLVADLRAAGYAAAEIGRLTEGAAQAGRIIVGR